MRGRLASAYWYPHNVSLGVLCPSNENGAKQDANSTQQGADSECKLCPPRAVDKKLRLLAHGLRVRVSVGEDEIAIGVFIEIDHWAVLLLLR